MKRTYLEQEVVKEWIVIALLDLMDQKAYSDINVTDIVRKAGVPRSTFYRYFGHKDEILKKYFEYLVECLTAEFRKNRRVDFYQLIQIQFEFFENYSEYFKALKKIHGEHIIFDRIREEINRIPYEEKDKVYLTYQATALYAILLEWAVKDEREDISYMTDMIFHFVDLEKIKKAFPIYINEYHQL